MTSSRNKNYLYPGLWRAVGFVMLGIAVAAFLVPVPSSIPVFSFEDKVAHFLIYSVLTCWFLQIYPRQGRILFSLVLMGILIEGLQSMTSYRSAEITDVLANMFGVSGGWLLARSPLGQLAAILDGRLALIMAKRRAQ
jgi:VanZ family protein